MNRQGLASWSANQERLVILVASGQGIQPAAAEIEFGERTAHHWLDDPRFRGRTVAPNLAWFARCRVY